MPLFRNIASMIALLPMIVISLTVFVGCIIYSFVYSLTNSKLVPVLNYVGFDQYERLFKQRKWDVAVENIFIYGFVFTIGCLVIGFLLAVLIDQKIRGESLFRTIFLNSELCVGTVVIVDHKVLGKIIKKIKTIEKEFVTLEGENSLSITSEKIGRVAKKDILGIKIFRMFK